MTTIILPRNLPALDEIPMLSLVDEHLWQGRYPGSAGFDRPFAHVLNLYPWEAYAEPPGAEIRRVEIYDAAELPPVALLEDLASWVNDRRRRGPTLVHCQAGLNRSGLVVALALIRSGVDPRDAIAQIRERRSPFVLFNLTFARWLETLRAGPA